MNIDNMTQLPRQGLSRCSLYSAEYNGQSAVVKKEVRPSPANDDRFKQELELLKLGLDHVVNLIDYDEADKVMVLERLTPLTGLTQEVINAIFWGSRQLYLAGHRWTTSPKHVMLDESGNPKLLDLNDDPLPDNGWLDKEPYCNHEALAREMGATTQMIDEAYFYTVQQEYLRAENVHQPLPWSIYKGLMRTESEKDDPNYGKPVPPNRECADRSVLLLKNIPLKEGALLDLGSNVGWFCFEFARRGFHTLGVDLDPGKIALSNMLADLHHVPNAKFKAASVGLDNVDEFSHHDVILALSVLHPYFRQHHYTSEQWKEFVTRLTAHCKVFIIEVPAKVGNYIGGSGYPGLRHYLQTLGFQTRSVGTSDNGRQLFVGTR